MAKLGDAHIHLTWDTEATDGAKNLVRAEVRKVLQETFQDSSWLTEFVRAEVHKALHEEDSKPVQAAPQIAIEVDRFGLVRGLKGFS